MTKNQELVAIFSLLLVSGSTTAQTKPPLPPAPPPPISAEQAARYNEMRISECQKLFVNRQYCECQYHNAPGAFNFPQYVRILIRSKEENGYDKLDPKMQSAYDRVAQVHAQCSIYLRNSP